MSDLKMVIDSIEIFESDDELSIDKLNSDINKAVLSIPEEYRKSARINLRYVSMDEGGYAIFELLYDRLEYPHERDSRLRNEKFFEDREKAQYERLKAKFEGTTNENNTRATTIHTDNDSHRD